MQSLGFLLKAQQSERVHFEPSLSPLIYSCVSAASLNPEIPFSLTGKFVGLISLIPTRPYQKYTHHHQVESQSNGI